MKHIQKILWSIATAFIAIVFKTDLAQAAGEYYDRKFTEVLNNGIRLSITTTPYKCNWGTTYNCPINTILNDIESKRQTVSKCPKGTYLSSCECATGLDCCNETTDVNSITCTTCPSPGTTTGVPVYFYPAQEIKPHAANDADSYCCHRTPGGNVISPDGTLTSYIFRVYILSGFILNEADASTDCFLPKATTYNDTTGNYQFTNSCYYN